jgi:hypothetical protein
VLRRADRWPRRIGCHDVDISIRYLTFGCYPARCAEHFALSRPPHRHGEKRRPRGPPGRADTATPHARRSSRVPRPEPSTTSPRRATSRRALPPGNAPRRGSSWACPGRTCGS